MDLKKYFTETRVFFLLFTLLLFYFAFLTFNYLIGSNLGDFATHIQMAEFYKSNSRLAPNFIMYLLISCLSYLFSNSLSLSLILSFAISLKFVFTFYYFKDIKSHSKSSNYFLFAVFAFLFLFINQIVINFSPDKSIYLGNILLTVWHNSSTIFLMPFVIILFHVSLKYIKTKNVNYLFTVLLLLIINIYIKPSFVYVYLFAFIIMFVFHNGFNFRQLKPILILTFIGGLLVFKQYFDIKTDIALDFYGQRSTEVVLSPFKVWLFFTENYSKTSLFTEILVSFAFPLIFTILYLKTAIKNIDYQFSFLLLIGAVLILILFSETGERAWHGNFFWQAYICNYIYFIASFKIWLSIVLERNKLVLYDYFILSVLVLHLIGGSYYLYKIIVFLNYT